MKISISSGTGSLNGLGKGSGNGLGKGSGNVLGKGMGNGSGNGLGIGSGNGSGMIYLLFYLKSSPTLQNKCLDLEYV